MVQKMKAKFDKYWGECNLLMAVGCVLDPRCKMRALEFSFPKLYTSFEAESNIKEVERLLYAIYKEYSDALLKNFKEQEPILNLKEVAKKDVTGSPNKQFDALGWWKLNTYKFPVLSTMARDILAIPITTVASEATFSAGSRVIDKYRSSLAATTVEMLMCGGDWCRKRHGVTKKTKAEKQALTINLPMD
ncbi:zinc finger BED domain-containing protein RICESLEEPER 3-like [Primulina eburnea]|uniref:zinc finger BED domain-containing protein RICESLEEPER 3-like n=1 Tax=Primulina eburnea TaxID=1245227 RepID=UPI003C6CAFA7